MLTYRIFQLFFFFSKKKNNEDFYYSFKLLKKTFINKVIYFGFDSVKNSIDKFINFDLLETFGDIKLYRKFYIRNTTRN